MPNNELIGRGWAYPVSVSGTGGIALSSGTSDIEEAIRMILGTAPGERAMRPDFGCRIHELVFAPAAGETLGLAKHYVEEALGWWEPRIDVLDVTAENDASDALRSRLLVSVQYQVRATKDERTLVYPFYLIEDEHQG
jgi:phage baseplate assembly protein W